VEIWNGRKIYMAHGDLGNPSEKSYHALRYVLRTRVIQKVLGTIPPPLLFRLGEGASRLSRNFQKKVPPDEAKVRLIYRETAKGHFAAGYDVVIMGHTHYPDHFTWNEAGRECHYYNLGDWVKNFTYLEFDGSEFYTRTHPVKNL
jgi:UDP-2,3-diacylglucosamine hydrolase